MDFPLPSDYDELDKLAADPTGSICWICNQFESFNGQEPYTVCFECGHVFRTDRELVDEYNKFSYYDEGWHRVVDLPPHEIPFCPLCLHDF